MHARHSFLWPLSLLWLLWLAGCGHGRPAPTPRSAASLDAARGRSLSVARALTSEPPLPGESTEGWEGLEGERLEAAPVASHGAHDAH
jgi:predicted small lipoprotein YifL